MAITEEAPIPQVPAELAGTLNYYANQPDFKGVNLIWRKLEDGYPEGYESKASRSKSGRLRFVVAKKSGKQLWNLFAIMPENS